MKSLKALYQLQAFFSGSMIAIRVPPEQWYKLRSSVKDPLDTPHVTIAYMPNLVREEIPQVKKAVEKALKNMSPFKVKVDKISVFKNAENKHGKVPHVALLERKKMTDLYNNLVKELQKIRPDMVSTKFKVYKPHTTLQWIDKKEPLPILQEPIEWDVNEVHLYFKNAKRESFSLNKKENPVEEFQESLIQSVVALVKEGKIDEAYNTLKVQDKRNLNS